MIKVVTLEYETPHIFGCGSKYENLGTVTRYKYFKSYIAENGKAVYVVGDELVTKEEGNNIYKELINNNPNYKATVHKTNTTDNEICKILENCIDPYYYYIDNTKDAEAVHKHNEEIYKILEAFKKVANS